MKAILPAVFVAAIMASGCATRQHQLVLDPIGPATYVADADTSDGTLVVYSALDQSPHFNGVSYHVYYSDYKVLTDQGAVLRKVHNDSNSVTEGPVPVTLRPGHYNVYARANGYGWVTVPVVVATRQTTVVRLDGSASWTQKKQISESNPVRLPHGEIAGWRAEKPPVAQSGN